MAINHAIYLFSLKMGQFDEIIPASLYCAGFYQLKKNSFQFRGLGKRGIFFSDYLGWMHDSIKLLSYHGRENILEYR